MTYYDAQGRRVTLDALCRAEPEWAAARIRSLTSELAAYRKRGELYDGILPVDVVPSPAHDPPICIDMQCDVTGQFAASHVCEKLRPPIEWTPNADAGDHSGHCSACGQARDDPHTLSDCLVVVSSERDAALDELAASQARVARLREALEPFGGGQCPAGGRCAERLGSGRCAWCEADAALAAGGEGGGDE